MQSIEIVWYLKKGESSLKCKDLGESSLKCKDLEEVKTCLKTLQDLDMDDLYKVKIFINYANGTKYPATIAALSDNQIEAVIEELEGNL